MSLAEELDPQIIRGLEKLGKGGPGWVSMDLIGNFPSLGYYPQRLITRRLHALADKGMIDRSLGLVEGKEQYVFEPL